MYNVNIVQRKLVNVWYEIKVTSSYVVRLTVEIVSKENIQQAACDFEKVQFFTVSEPGEAERLVHQALQK